MADSVPQVDIEATVHTAGSVSVGGSVTGEITQLGGGRRDHDWFAVSLEAGKTYRIEVRGAETGDGTLADPILVGMYDATGTFVGGGDDNGGVGRNSLKYFTPATAGTYHVAARAHGANTGTYTVAVEEIAIPEDDFSASTGTAGTVAVGGSATGEITRTAGPRDHDWFAVSLEAGKTYRIDVKGAETGDGTLADPILVGMYDATGTFVGGGDDNGGVGRNSLKSFAPETTGTYHVATRAHGTATGTYTVAVEEITIPEDDFSASTGTAGTVAVGGSATGEITRTVGPRDHDWFAVSLEAGKTYRIDVKGAETGDGTLADPILVGMYDATGTFVGGGDDNGGVGRNSLKYFTPATAGTYHVAARAHGANTGTYTVAVEEIPQDDFSASTGTAGAVAVGGSATGEITPTAGPLDHDWFAVTLEAGKTYRIDVKGAETGDGTLANPVLVGMYDATGTFVGGGDDNGGAGLNSLRVFAPETTGTYHVAARAHGGHTGTYTVAVEEVSDDFSASTGTAGAVAVGGSATGEIGPAVGAWRDHDWFAVTLEAGKTYRIEVRGSETGDGTLADPILVGIYDATGTFVGGGDDNGGAGRNSLTAFAPETTGTYHVAARAHGANTGTYTVAVEEVPQDDFSASTGTAGAVAVGGSATGEITLTAGSRDHDWFAVSLEAGKTYRIDVKGRHTGDGTLLDPVLVGMYDAAGTFVGGTGDDDGGVGFNSLKFFVPETTGTYHVAARAQGGNTGTYTVAVEEIAIPEDDFSASTGTAGTVAVGGSATGEITRTAGPPRDHDWFAVSLEAGKTYRIDVKGRNTGDGTLFDPILVGMYDATGTFVGGGDDNGGADYNSLTFFAPETTGTYYVAARAHGANTGTYTVAVEEVSQDDFSASTGTAGAVAVGGSATGEITRIAGLRDHDWFAVSLEAGKTYRIDVRGSETGDGTLADPALVGMYDATGTFVGGGDDNGGAGLNSLTVFTPATTGTYHVAARAHGANTGTYTVAVEEVSDDLSASTGTAGAVAVGGSATSEIGVIGGLRDHDWFAVSLEAGKTYRIDVRGSETGDGTLADPVLAGMYDAAGTLVGGTGDDNGGAGLNSLKFFVPETTGTYYVAARAHGANTGTYTVAVEEVSDDFSASTGTAGAVAVGGSATGEITRIAGLRDHDWFAVSLEAGKTYRIDVKGAETGDGTLANPILVGMYDATGTFIGGGDDDGGAGLNSLRVFAPETTGTYYVAARAHGVNTGTYTVAVEEVSQDDFSASTGTAGTVAVGGSATGEITLTAGSRDHDWFAVSLEAGKTYRIEVRGSETGDGTLADPVLVGMYDATGTFVGGTDDDNGGAGRNSLTSFTSETTGTYHVAARAHGANTGTYTVAVEEIALPGDDFSASTGAAGAVAVGGSATGEIDGAGDHDWFAVSLEAGKRYGIEVRGSGTGDGMLADPVLVGMYDATGTFIGGTGDDNGGRGFNSLTFFTPETAGTYYVAARAHSANTGTYTVAVDELEDDFSAAIGTAGAVAVGGSAMGEIDGAGDHDWFAVSLEAGKTYRIDVKGRNTPRNTGDGTLFDPELVGMYDAAGTFIGGTGDDNGGAGFNSLKFFAPETTGTYHVAARAHGANTGTYTVAVEEVSDDFSASTGTAGAVAVGGSATGEITRIAGLRDHDWFAASLEAGKTYRIEVRGSETGDGTLADPVLVGIYDAAGTFVGGGDDDGGVGFNSLKFFAPETTGTYHVAARAHGANTGTYTVAVEEVSDDLSASIGTAGAVAVGGSATGEITWITGLHDHDWFAVSLEAGKTYRIDVRGSETGDGTLRDPVLVGVYDATGEFIGGTGDDDGGAGRNSLKFFTPEADGTYYVAASSPEAFVLTGTYTVAVEEIAIPEDDLSASTGTAGAVAVGGSATGEITLTAGPPRDHDWFAVSLEAGKTYRIDVRGSETGDGTLRDPVLVGVYDATGEFIGGTGDDDGGAGRNSLKFFTPEADGTYHVAARAHGVNTGTYTVAVEEVSQDDFSASTGTAGTVAVGGSATGEITLTAGPRDHDWFAVSLEAGKIYRIDVRGSETGDGTLADPVLVGMYDATGTFVGGTDDDNGGAGRNSLTVFTPETTGTYYVAARAHGVNTGTYTVAVEEVSQDDFSASTGTAGTVAVGGSATGEITLTAGPRDHDWFAVSLEAGKIYRIEVRGSETGDGTLADPILVGIYDATGTFIGGGDDNGGVGRNSLKVFTPETTGTYHVAARAHGANTGTYTVAVEEVPQDDFSASTGTAGAVAVGGSATGEITLTAGSRDHDWFAVSLEAGKTYRIEVRGSETGDGTLADPILVGMYDATGTFIGGGDDNGGAGLNSLRVFAPETTGTYHVAARAHGGHTGTYTVAVEEVSDDFSASTGTAGAVAVGGSATGEITLTAGPRDHDWFAVSLVAGKSYRIEVRGSETGDGTLADPILVGMYDATGTFIGGGDDNGGAGRNSLKSFAPETTGTYHVAARAHGANTGTYTVAVNEVEDDYAASATLAMVEMGEVRVVEGGMAVFTIRLSHAATGEVTVEWSVGGTVTAGDDYTGAAGPFVLTFAAGETEKTVEIQTLDDTASEGDETLTVTTVGSVRGDAGLGRLGERYDHGRRPCWPGRRSCWPTAAAEPADGRRRCAAGGLGCRRDGHRGRDCAADAVAEPGFVERSGGALVECGRDGGERRLHRERDGAAGGVRGGRDLEGD